MLTLSIDNRSVTVPAGATLLQAARAAGIHIPTLCYWEGLPPQTSCLVCVVKVQGLRRLVPACAFPARDGMVVESETPEVHNARRTAIELLLGDHLGDCVGPCVSICPTHMDIPGMMAQLKAGQPREALATAKEMMALPAILGHICPAPCENGCRRKDVDEAVAIRQMHRYAAEAGAALSGTGSQQQTEAARGTPSADPSPRVRSAHVGPLPQGERGKTVAIVGAGPAGLAAAWHLLRQGLACVLFDEGDEPGGKLRYGVEPSRLPRAVLDGEIGIIAKLGAQFRMKQKLGAAFSLEELRKNHAAVLLAIGEVSKETAAALGYELAGRGLKVQGNVLPGKLDGIFAAGASLLPGRMAVRSVASGRLAAVAIAQFLAGQPIAVTKDFSVHMGKLEPDELKALMEGVNPAPRMKLAAEQQLTPELAGGEAARCLQCGCLKERDCTLRQYAAQYGAQAAKYKGERRHFDRSMEHPQVVFEPGKCIACGRCVQIAGRSRDAVGLTYVGRGFNVRIGVPFNQTLKAGLGQAAAEVARACPTAAIARKPTGLTTENTESTENGRA